MSLGLVYSGEIRDNGTPFYFRHALSRLGVEHKWYWPQYGIPEGHDWYFVVDDGRDDLEHEPPHPCVYYATDTHLGYEVRRRKAEHFDLIYCAQKDAAEKFASEGLNAHWLPLACSPDHHPTAGELGDTSEPTYDLAFVGHLQKPTESNRIEFLDGFVRVFRERIRLEFGRFHHDMARAYHKARLGVNHCVRRDLNMRTFELASVGVPQLCDGRMIGLREIGFEPYRHYVPYMDSKDAVDAAVWILQNDGGLKAMARRANDLVRSEHTYETRCKRILADVAGLIGKGLCGNSEPVSTAVVCGPLKSSTLGTALGADA